jgi:hypothetical protein
MRFPRSGSFLNTTEQTGSITSCRKTIWTDASIGAQPTGTGIMVAAIVGM